MSLPKRCVGCPTKAVCFLTGLPDNDRERIRAMMALRPTVQKGQPVFEAGEPLRSLYFVRSGSVKYWKRTFDGAAHVMRFHLSGQVLGLGAVCSGVHGGTATALEATTVCHLPLQRVQQLINEGRGALHGEMMQWMSQEIVHNEQMISLIANARAVIRVATFLNELSRAHEVLGHSPKSFNLTMCRLDIAAYLGTTLETVSRTFSQLRRDGILSVKGKRITVLDPNGLSTLSETIIDAPGIRRTDGTRLSHTVSARRPG